LVADIGGINLTSPCGHACTTTPAKAELFPQMATPTGEFLLGPATGPLSAQRGVMMPTRKRARAQDEPAESADGADPSLLVAKPL
jgi:hypothetical protein